MSSRSERVIKQMLCALLCAVPLAPTAMAASGCAALEQVPGVIEIDQGLQQELRLPVAITRAAIGEPKIADVHASGTDAVLLTAVGPGATA